MLIPCVLFLLCITHAMGQQYASRQYTIRDGLPSNRVRTFFKDSRDMLWIGTDAGLAIYDGESITRVELPESVESKKVWAIEEDPEGNLWIGTFGSGLLKYNGQEFEKISVPELACENIRVLYYSQRFNFLLGGSHCGFFAICNGESTSFIPDTITNDRFPVMGFIEDQHGVIFHTHRKGIFHFNPETGNISSLPDDSPLNYSASSASFVTSRGDTLMGLNRNGLRIIGEEGVKDLHDLGQVFDIKEDREGLLWIAAWSYHDMAEPGGLYTYDGKNLNRVGPDWGIESPMVWSIFIDTLTETILVATDGEGFYKLINRGISRYPASLFGARQLDIYDVAVYDGNIWATAEDRVIFGNEREGFRVLDQNYFMERVFFPGHQIDSAIINPPGKFLSLHIDTGNDLWIGSVNAMFRLQNSPFDFIRFNLGKRFSENFHVFPDGRAFSGTWYYFREAFNIFKSDRYRNFEYLIQYPADVNRIIQREDELWFSSFTYGLYRYRNGEFIRFREIMPHFPQNLSTLVKDNHGNIITGTHDGRVLILEGSDSLTVKFELGPDNGITGNEILWLLCDSHNRLWAGTNLGLNVIHLDDLYLNGHASTLYFNESEGYVDFSVRSAAEDEHGIIWLGGKHNLVRIDPEILLRQPDRIPTVELKSFVINFKELDWDTLDNVWRNVPSEAVFLSHRQNNLSMSFTVDNLFNPDKIHYSFFLQGLSFEPSPFSSSNEANFTNLSPGKYTLQVAARNLQTGQDYYPLVLEFYIRPPWWRTWYFYAALTLLITAAVLLVMQLRIQRVRKLEMLKLEHEKRLNTIRIQAAQAQMNPHFVFNVLSSIQYFMLNNDMDSTLEYLNDFSILIRQTMDNISQETIPLCEEIDYLQRYIKLEDLRLGESVFSKIIVGKEIDAENLRIPPMVVQPFVENALKHGLSSKQDDRKLCISFRQNDTQLCIQVCDNGIGLKPSPANQSPNGRHTSKGIRNTTERVRYFAQQYNGEGTGQYGITITNRMKKGQPSGVRVEIGLPVVI